MKNFNTLMTMEGVKAPVLDLFMKLSGDKLEQVSQAAVLKIKSGKEPERAMAEALEDFKLVGK